MFPHERSLVERLKDKPFALIGVNSDRKLEEAKKKNQSQQISWRSFWCGPAGTGGPIPRQFNVRAWPTLYLIDHKGIIRQRYVGNPGDKVLDAEIDKLIKEAEQSTRAGG
jgi:hypothetical protein